MAGKKSEPTHNVYTVTGNSIEKAESAGSGELVRVIIPKDMPYVKVRKALEIALLRVR